MLPIGTRVQRINSPDSGRIGTIVGDMIKVVETYLVSFDGSRMPQYWSPKYFRVIDQPSPDWKV